MMGSLQPLEEGDTMIMVSPSAVSSSLTELLSTAPPGDLDVRVVGL